MDNSPRSTSSRTDDATAIGADQDAAWRRACGWTIAICAGLLILFASVAWSAVSGKSPTFDEPYHAFGACLRMWHGEYRFISDDPPLWGELAAALTGPGAVGIDPKPLDQIDLPMDESLESVWMVRTLFQTPGNDGVVFIARFRVVMLAVAVAMGSMLAWFVWQLSRAIGASASAAGAGSVLATALLALDPNFLAHSPLMKNDVASALMFLGLIASTWSAGRLLTLRRILALGMWSGAAMMVKFNAPIMIASSVILLTGRAILPWAWQTDVWPASPGRLVSRVQRLGAASMTLAVMFMMTVGIIWCSYSFRYSAAATPGVTMNFPNVVQACVVQSWQSSHPNEVPETSLSRAQIATMPLPTVVRLALWTNDLHLLPEAFCAGTLFTFQSVQARSAFLWGRFSIVGTWWYFPFTMAVKTPISTLAAIAAAAAIGLIQLFRRTPVRPASSESLPMGIWSAMCLGIPAGLYLAAAMSSNVNLGLRYVLPSYIGLFAATGLAMAKFWDLRRTTAQVSGLIVLALLASESLAAYPNFIPFFNVFVGGSRGGLRLLSDSNLDWGQDLPLLAQWQRDHAHTKLYLAYFGTTDPAVYGIRYTNLENGYQAGPPPQPLTTPGVIAISATVLQGTYWIGQAPRPHWASLWSLKPFDVLGGSIYLFHYPATQADRLPAGQSLID